MDFILEMEKAEEILKVKWNEISSGKCKRKDIIEKLFVLLKDRQSITAAAFQALETYETLKEQSDEVARSDKALFREFTQWLKLDRDGEEHLKEELDAVMGLYEEVVKLTRRILTEFRICEKTDKKVGLELKNLNSTMNGFPQRLEHSDVLEFGKFRWPVKQSKKVSRAVEHSFDQMDYIRTLMKQLNEKHEILKSVFQQRNMNSHSSSSHARASGSSSSSFQRY